MRTFLVAALSVLALAALPARAAADDAALMANATMVKPLGGDGRVTESRGAGGEIVMLPDNMIVQIGGFGVIGQHIPGKTARDLYDLHLMVGLLAGGRRASLSPYGALGIDVLSMTTRLPETDAPPDDRIRRGTTLGISAQLGALGRIGDRGLFRVSASYLGAIVPGTGDDLGGLVLQLALGARFD